MSYSPVQAASSAVLSSGLPLPWLLQRLIAQGRVPPGSVATSVAENVYASSHPSEVLTLQTPDSKTLTLFCKHGAPPDESWLAHGHRGGLSYEAEVYRRVLLPLEVTVPAFYGAFHHAAQDEDYLALEQLDDALAVSKWDDSEVMPRAAYWAGTLHARAERKLTDNDFRFLNAYDRDYYLGWSSRTLEFSRLRSGEGSWLARLCSRYEVLVDLLLAAPRTIIHGEYYPKNILVRWGVVFPVDWESAALASGEIDLASLIQGWSPEVICRCTRAYADARWGRDVPNGFSETLTAAQLYWRFRWLGHSVEWSAAEEYGALLEELRSFAEDSSLL
jgi:hypothetical protein